jgi:hypothetical protein
MADWTVALSKDGPGLTLYISSSSADLSVLRTSPNRRPMQVAYTMLNPVGAVKMYIRQAATAAQLQQITSWVRLKLGCQSRSNDKLSSFDPC